MFSPSLASEAEYREKFVKENALGQKMVLNVDL
jgi:hypothetical protein